MTTSVDPAFSHWFVGFSDGEGSFMIHPRKVSFSIAQRSDNWKVLKSCRDHLDIGKLYRRAVTDRMRESRPGHKPQVCWRVETKSDNLVLRDFFLSNPPRGKKLPEFKLWCRALYAWSRPDLTSHTWQTMLDLKANLFSLRQYRTPTDLVF